MSDAPAEAPLRGWGRVRLALRVWATFARVHLGLRRHPLPALVHELGMAERRPDRHSPSLLSLAVHRSLHIGPMRPRCLVNALVLFRLLREQGEAAEVVIGLPPAARDHAAHAWVELGGRDVGPPPGRGAHAPMARLS